MNATRKLVIELPEHIADRIDAEVASGAYADVAAAVVESVTLNWGVATELEPWLVQEVGAAYDAWRADDRPGVSAGEALEQVRARHAARKSAG